VTLEVFDSSGKSVRRFSSDDKPAAVDEKELNVPTYWIRPERTLSREPGMHRFAWDLHYPPPDALDHEYPISAIYRDTPRYPLGPAVVPGVYAVKLTANGKSYDQRLTIQMDPRVKTSQKDLIAQVTLETGITDAMHSDFVALTQVRDLRTRLKSLKQSHSANIPRQVEELAKDAADLEGTEGGYGATFLTGPAGNSLARLNGALTNLLATVDSADSAPTTQAVEMFEHVQRALDQQLGRWKEIQTQEIPTTNEALKRVGMPTIDLK
jgi:hypothetical protein